METMGKHSKAVEICGEAYEVEHQSLRNQMKAYEHMLKTYVYNHIGVRMTSRRQEAREHPRKRL